MAHFAKLNSDNIVTKVEVVSNDVATNEQAGINFLNNLYGTNDVWKQTSYNENIRKNFAGIGYTYNQTKDALIALKPFNSWVLNDDTCKWESPVTYPDDGEQYKWNEDTTSWDAV